MEKDWGYNSWMKYLYNTLNGKANVSVHTKFGEIGNRSEIQIQDEIAYLKAKDKNITDKIRASYSIKK